VLRLLARLPLLHWAQQVVGVVPVEALRDVDHLHPGLPQEVALVAGLVIVQPAKALDVIHQHVAEGTAGSLGIVDQAR